MNRSAKYFSVMLLAAAMVFAGALAVVGYAETSEAKPNVSDQASKITIEGNATIYGHWACEGQANVDAIPGEALEPVPGFPGGVQTTMARVSVHDIECGDGTMNKHLRKALKEKDHPEIHFQMDKYVLENSGGEAKAIGELTIAGKTLPVEMDVELTPLTQGGIRVVGKLDIQMKDYGVKPPSLLFGTLKVDNDVTVSFDSAIPSPDEMRQSASLETQ